MRAARTVLVAVAATILTGCAGGDVTGEHGDLLGPVTVSASDVAAGLEDAGCAEVAADAGGTEHLDAGDATAAELYEVRPGTAGPHLAEWLDPGVREEPADERAVVHNHEHGAVSVWYAAGNGDAAVGALTQWAEARNAAGLETPAGAGIIASPTDAELSDGVTVAFRSWTGGLDCAEFTAIVGDGFVLDHYGEAPEGNLAADVSEVLRLEEGESP
jgi:hypothetical protein